MRRIICIVFFISIFYLFAEEVKYYDYIGPFVGYNYFCNNSNHKDEVKFGLNFERYLKKEPISVQVSFGYVPLKIKIPSERKDIYSLGIDAIYNYKAFNLSNLKLSPYLSCGVNQNFFDENTFGVAGATGLKFFSKNNILIKTEIKYINIFKHNRDDLLVSLSLNFPFVSKYTQSQSAEIKEEPKKQIKIKVEEIVVNEKIAEVKKEEAAEEPKTAIAEEIKAKEEVEESKAVSEEKVVEEEKEAKKEMEEKKIEAIEVKEKSEESVKEEEVKNNEKQITEVVETQAAVEVKKEEAEEPKTAEAEETKEKEEVKEEAKSESEQTIVEEAKKTEEEKASEQIKEKLLVVYFDLDKAEVKEEYDTDIEKFVNTIKETPEVKILIEGHTDNFSTPEYNLQLSEKRANAVKEVLVNKFGIEENRIIIKGYGETKPVESNETEEGRSKNRRVECFILK